MGWTAASPTGWPAITAPPTARSPDWRGSVRSGASPSAARISSGRRWCMPPGARWCASSPMPSSAEPASPPPATPGARSSRSAPISSPPSWAGIRPGGRASCARSMSAFRSAAAEPSVPPMTAPIGRVVATELKPSTPHQFHFWTARESPIGIGAIVRVAEGGRTVHGVVTDGFAYSDLMTPMHAVIGADGDPVAAGVEPTARAEIRLFTAAVLRQIPEEPLQPVPLGSVWLADDADVLLALRMDSYTGGERPSGVPVGLYAAGGLESPVYLDCDFLLGPEAAHLNITGVSGLATETSAAEFLLASIFQTFPAHKGSVAALCFNVKGPDLCFLDQPADLSAEDRRLYQRLGLRPEPFADVHYYAPHRPDGVNLNTLRTNETLAANTQPLVWGLREVLDYAEVLLNRDDVDAKADAFIDFLAERVVRRESQDDMLRGRPFP